MHEIDAPYRVLTAFCLCYQRGKLNMKRFCLCIAILLLKVSSAKASKRNNVQIVGTTPPTNERQHGKGDHFSYNKYITISVPCYMHISVRTSILEALLCCISTFPKMPAITSRLLFHSLQAMP